MIGEMLAGKLVGDNTYGERAVNLITSGTGSMLSKVASMGGNGIMSRENARSYAKVQSNVLASYANFERSTHSPFDASNPNTFLGSIYTKAAPYLASASSPTGVLGSVFGVVSSITSNVFSPATKALNVESYDECKDPDYVDLKIATDPFCNPVVGIPPQYLDLDPEDVASRLVAANHIDAVTGEPKSDTYKRYVANCPDREIPYGTSQDGEIDTTSECMIDSEEKAVMAVYYVDRRALDISENDLPSAELSSSRPPTSDDSGAIGEAGETTDKNWGGHQNGRIPLSALVQISHPGCVSQMSKPYLNANANTAINALNEEYKKTFNKDLDFISCYRDYEGQVYAKRTKGRNAATPGTSNHGWALAVDLGAGGGKSLTYDSKEYKWLLENAPRYGYVNPPSMQQGGKGPHEPWHFQYQRPAE